MDDKGFLYVSDPNNQRIQVLTPDGKDHKTLKVLEQGSGPVFLGKAGELVEGSPRMRFLINQDEEKPAALPKLVKVRDREGKLLREFGEPRDFGDDLVNNGGNEVIMTVDGAGQVYLVFPVQNRIEKYAADGRLLWRADRELPYSMEIKEKGKVDRQGGGVSIRMPQMNRCASGVAVDGKGRVWVVGMTRQLKKEEQVGTAVTMNMDSSGGRTIGYQVQRRGSGAADDRRLQARSVRRGRRPARFAAARSLRRRHLHLRRPALPHGQVPRHPVQGIPDQGLSPLFFL